MLIRFAVSNFRSIDKRMELSMVSADENAESPLYQESLGVELLPEAAIYGANASGKSNVLLSLQWLKYAVMTSLQFWDDSVPLDPFAFSGDDSRPSAFELEMLVDGVHYEYYLEANRERIHYESVYATREGNRICLLEREEDSLRFDDSVQRKTAIEELLTPRTLVMSIARRYDEASLSDLLEAIQSMQFLGESSTRYATLSMLRTAANTRDLFDDGLIVQPSLFDFDSPEFDTNGTEQRERALAWLRMVDLGIRDVRVVEDTAASGRKRKKVELLHASPHGDSPLDFRQESEGTRAWFRLIGPAIAALDAGAPLVFDELDASLHPVLAAQLLRFFQDKDMNPHGAQLVFTSHDTSLMQYLKSDEIWLTEKHDGVTTLYPLTSFDSQRVKDSVDLESGYRHGRFGGIPELDLADFLRSKGVIA